jgi:hypothetical protein
MSIDAKSQSNALDELAVKYGGYVVSGDGLGPNCGMPALMRYVKQNNIPLPLTAEQEEEIDAILAG